MGHTSYSVAERSSRAFFAGYHTKSADDIFTQNKARKIHDSMKPQGINKREAFDSENHPNTLAVICALDFTGSMRQIPHELIKDGLPTLMSNLIQKGAKDAAVLFLGIGDHECDRAPLQVGQFESGDAELDMWLTRSYIEGKGGGNAGESYLLAWYFAAFHTDIDCFKKRGQKGFLFTIGDEPNLKNLPASAVKEIMGVGQAKSYTDVELLEAAQKMYNVYHIVVLHTSQARSSLTHYWHPLLGQNCIGVNSPTDVADTISNIVNQHIDNSSPGQASPKPGLVPTPIEEIL